MTNVTIKCVKCGVEITGHMDELGVIRAARTPINADNVADGLCMTCLDKMRADEAFAVVEDKEPAPVVTGAPVPGATTTT